MTQDPCGRHHMEQLSTYLSSYASCTAISLIDSSWHTQANVPNEAGWYFIRTNCPVAVLKQQHLWDQTYTTARSGMSARVKNYDIASRAQRFKEDFADYWNIVEVYSGMASSLQARAREHTFANPGTAGLALSRYVALREYEWTFGFVTLRRFNPTVSRQDMLLHLGEQIWRAKNGWPLLCAA
jgi:hypothetical protein